MKTNVTIRTTDDAGNDTITGVEVGEIAQQHVLRNFNVTNDVRVDEVKVLCAALIQRMIELRDAPGKVGHEKRAAAMAISLIEGAQMQAVKAFFVQA